MVAIDSELRLTLFTSFCAQPSEVSVLFYSNLRRCPFLGEVVIYLLLSTGFFLEDVVLFLCLFLLTRRMLNETMGAALVGDNFSPIPSKISFHMKRKWLVTARTYMKSKWLVAAQTLHCLQSIETFLPLELSLYRKSSSMFSSSEPVAARSDCRPLGNVRCLCSPVRPAQAVPESCPKSLAVDFAL